MELKVRVPIQPSPPVALFPFLSSPKTTLSTWVLPVALRLRVYTRVDHFFFHVNDLIPYTLFCDSLLSLS